MRALVNIGLAGHGEDFAGLLNDSDYRICAVFDPEHAQAEALARTARPETEVCTSLEALLARTDVELAVLAAPARLLAGQVCAALTAGKHVLCGASGALTEEETERIVCAERSAGRTVAFANSRLRCGGYTDLARHYLTAGKLGRIYRVEAVYYYACQPSNPVQATQSLLETIGVQLLDQVLDLVNWPRVETLSAHAFEDHTCLYARLAGGTAASFDLAASAQLRPRHTVTILGDRGGLLLDHTEGGRGFSFFEEAPGLRAKLVESKAHFKLEPWGSNFRRFHEHLTKGSLHPGTTAAQARELTRWLSMAHASCELDREVTGCHLEPAFA